jgi:hypothetical protein
MNRGKRIIKLLMGFFNFLTMKRGPNGRLKTGEILKKKYKYFQGNMGTYKIGV